ncbi:PspA/IM30 family protein [Cronbergia sp. UHCC 0137]|uniref:PspA/IM30 family protein n=1 Tax=Cronbergia sp. UHCC 0137 TaxID=3110239 RepID=UPI002B20C863|nr:PspA/IM30 family protein [Cronbergia sp. UHCC 0137]MEA5620212.1 PspA/IM30 family protein [Cronbergia sp. UHCC 0137]
MELMKRVLRVVSANLNSLVRDAEDPEKILEKAFMEMQQNLLELRRGVAIAIATQKRTERQAAASVSQAEEWYRRAQIALKQGNESLAREALTKRHAYQQTAKTLSNQLEQQGDVVGKLKQNIRELELKIAELKTKKDMYIARARSAEASYRLQEMLSGMSDVANTGVLERMEEKVLQIEAQSAAIAQLGADDLEQRFATLASVNNNDINAEIAAMKIEILNQVDNTKQDIAGVRSQESGVKSLLP